jgi:hypothetical protein
MDITCKKKSEALATLESVLVQISFSFSLQFCWSFRGDLFAAAAAAAVLQYCVKLFL